MQHRHHSHQQPLSSFLQHQRFATKISSTITALTKNMNSSLLLLLGKQLINDTIKENSSNANGTSKHLKLHQQGRPKLKTGQSESNTVGVLMKYTHKQYIRCIFTYLILPHAQISCFLLPNLQTNFHKCIIIGSSSLS